MSESEEKFFSRKQQALGVGLGISLVGAIALAVRYGLRPRPPTVLPESLSPAIFATRVLPTSQGQLVYHVSGQGDPLVFLHGLYPGASSFEWARVYPEFTLSHEVLAPDLLGFGESERPAEALDLRAHAEGLLEFLHMVCGGRAPTLVASGLGCKVALLLASQHPELFERLILWLPVGVRRALRGRAAREVLGIKHLPWWRGLAWRSYLSSPAFFRSWVSRVGFAEEGAEDEEVVSVLTNCARLYQAEVAIWGFLRGSFGEDLSSRLKDIRCPTTVLWPEQSERFPLALGESLAREIPHAEFRPLAADGLLAPLRHPAFFQKILASCLGQAEGGSSPAENA
jgi:pimeloyl-ACP methyl ester carboxylesterase